MFPQVGGQQAADSVVRDEDVIIVQQASLGFIRFVLFLQGIVRDDLVQMERQHAGLYRVEDLPMNSTVQISMYLGDAFHSALLQDLLVEPLRLF